MDLHELGEVRSRAYHRAIAAKLVDDPAIVARALARIAGGTLHPQLADRWRAVLALPRDQLAQRLVDAGEEMAQLRSASPFAGELTPRERWQIWREVRDVVLTR